MPQHLSSFAEAALKYDGFILDVWGVLHDGNAAFPQAVESLQALKKLKKNVRLLSNAPRRAEVVAARLADMGITPDLYGGIVTSGEASWLAMRDRHLAQWGKRCYHLGPDRDASLYEGLDIALVDAPAKADFVLNTGVLDFADGVEKYAPILQECAGKNLPMLCANPDRVVHIGDKLVLCAGTFADLYEQMDGQVTHVGKPHRMVYKLCLEEMGKGRVLAVGDAMVTDIAGATGAGLDSILITSGIHRDDFSDPAAFFAKFPYRPTFTLDRLVW